MSLKRIALLLPALTMAFAQDRTGAPKTSFDVSSVKLNKTDEPPNSLFPLGPGAVFVPTGGRFSATGIPLINYIAFAYKLQGNDMQSLPAQLPSWAVQDPYDIQARVQGNPGKDEMRVLMRALLEDRFKLKVHYQAKEVPVLALVLVKAGKLGPSVQLHTGSEDCPTQPPSPATQVENLSNGLPGLCGGIFGMPSATPGQIRIAARNISTALLANSLPGATSSNRQLIDRTGITGTIDFSLEWALDRDIAAQPPDTPPDLAGAGFEAALKDQLGMKLESTRAEVQIFVVDHVDRPTED